jgi:hypothetical protein
VAAARAAAPAANPVTKPEARRIESRIAGEFDGWRHGTVLVLENGQRWEVRDEEPVSARLLSPRVVIEPGLLNGWTLSVEGVGELAHVLPAERH